MTNIWFPKEGTIKMDAAVSVTISASTVLDTAFSSATTVTGQFKDFSMTPGIGDADIIHLLGTTSSFQNAELEEKPAGICEISGTIVVPGDEIMESEIFGTGTAAGGTHTTYQPGLASRTKLAILLNQDDGTDELNFAVTNAVLTSYEPKFSGADGHLEASVTFKCLPKDFYGPQFKD